MNLDVTAASDAKLLRLSHLARLADDWHLFCDVDREITTRTWTRLTRYEGSL